MLKVQIKKTGTRGSSIFRSIAELSKGDRGFTAGQAYQHGRIIIRDIYERALRKSLARELKWYSSPGRESPSGYKSTGFLSKSVGVDVGGGGRGTTIAFTIVARGKGALYAKIHNFGGYISPKNKTFLTVPFSLRSGQHAQRFPLATDVPNKQSFFLLPKDLREHQNDREFWKTYTGDRFLMLRDDSTRSVKIQFLYTTKTLRYEGHWWAEAAIDAVFLDDTLKYAAINALRKEFKI